MIRLRVFGSLRLEDGDGRELSAVLAQPKRVALLAYLAAASPRGLHRRDSLLALFWSGLDAYRARKALNQAVGFLRRELRSASVITRHGSESLGIDATQCWCDAVAFEDAARAGRYGEALDLYRGDLLEGWFVDQAPGFEEWTERERSRLRGLAADAAGRIADAEWRAGRSAQAIRHAERAVKLSQLDERAFRRLLEFMDGSGNRVGAIKAYGDFRRLTNDLGVEPSAETRAAVERIRARSAAVEVVGNDFPIRIEAKALPNVALAREPRPSVAPKRKAVGLIIAAVAVAAASLLLATALLNS